MMHWHPMFLAALFMEAEHPAKPIRIVIAHLAAERCADPRPVTQPNHAIRWQAGKQSTHIFRGGGRRALTRRGNVGPFTSTAGDRRNTSPATRKEKMLDGRQVQVERWPGQSAAQLLYISGDMYRLHDGQLPCPVLFEPGAELADRGRVVTSRIDVADRHHEELDKAIGDVP